MSKFLSCLSAILFALAVSHATAATPKAAESADAPVYTTDEPKPYARVKAAKRPLVKAKKAAKKVSKKAPIKARKHRR